MLRKFFTLFFLLGTLHSFAQQTDSTQTDSADDDGPALIIKPDNTVPWKIGIKFGTGASTLRGAEMVNNTLYYTLNGGVYGRYRAPKKWILQAELTISMRGSMFDHPAGEYQLIRMYYCDLPVLACYAINETRHSNVVAGLQYSYLVNALMFVDMNPPVLAGNPKFKKSDLLGVLGMQFYTPFVGFQVLGKYSLLDINGGLLPGVNPVNRGKDIHSLVFEVNFLF